MSAVLVYRDWFASVSHVYTSTGDTVVD